MFFYFYFHNIFGGGGGGLMVESRTRNPKIVSSSLGPAGIVGGGGVNVQRSLHT